MPQAERKESRAKSREQQAQPKADPHLAEAGRGQIAASRKKRVESLEFRAKNNRQPTTDTKTTRRKAHRKLAESR